jgi:hypothetical protein
MEPVRAESRYCCVVGDTIEPTAPFFGFIETVDVLINFDKCFLDDIVVLMSCAEISNIPKQWFLISID